MERVFISNETLAKMAQEEGLGKTVYGGRRAVRTIMRDQGVPDDRWQPYVWKKGLMFVFWHEDDVVAATLLKLRWGSEPE